MLSRRRCGYQHHCRPASCSTARPAASQSTLRVKHWKINQIRGVVELITIYYYYLCLAHVHVLERTRRRTLRRLRMFVWRIRGGISTIVIKALVGVAVNASASGGGPIVHLLGRGVGRDDFQRRNPILLLGVPPTKALISSKISRTDSLPPARNGTVSQRYQSAKLIVPTEIIFVSRRFMHRQRQPSPAASRPNLATAGRSEIRIQNVRRLLVDSLCVQRKRRGRFSAVTVGVAFIGTASLPPLHRGARRQGVSAAQSTNANAISPDGTNRAPANIIL